MGSSVRGKCPCGFDFEVPMGGGMRNFSTTRYFPCLCEACHTIVPVNLLALAQQCPECNNQALISYDDPRMSESPGKGVVAGWDLKEQLGRELILTDGNYLCPKCNHLSLRFRDTGLRWD
jgi:hypothetical protein